MTRTLCTALLLACLATPGLPAAESFKPFKLKTPEGVQRTLSDVLGKATLVVFFFPTCRYCEAAFPDIKRLHDAYKDRGLSAVLINVLQEEEKLIAGWRKSHGDGIPVLLGGRSIQNDYNLTTTPTIYVLEAGGKVVARRLGFRPGDESLIEQDIQKALSASR